MTLGTFRSPLSYLKKGGNHSQSPLFKGDLGGSKTFCYQQQDFSNILLDGFISLSYLVLNGIFGNYNALQMARQVNFHIISKLRYDSVLHIPYKNPDSNKRFRRQSGEKIDYGNVSDEYLCNSTIEQDIKTDIYEAT